MHKILQLYLGCLKTVYDLKLRFSWGKKTIVTNSGPTPMYIYIYSYIACPYTYIYTHTSICFNEYIYIVQMKINMDMNMNVNTNMNMNMNNKYMGYEQLMISGTQIRVSLSTCSPTCSAPAWPATPRGISSDATGDDAIGRTKRRWRPSRELWASCPLETIGIEWNSMGFNGMKRTLTNENGDDILWSNDIAMEDLLCFLIGKLFLWPFSLAMWNYRVTWLWKTDHLQMITY